jgi:hypothetical protein
VKAGVARREDRTGQPARMANIGRATAFVSVTCAALVPCGGAPQSAPAARSHAQRAVGEAPEAQTRSTSPSSRASSSPNAWQLVRRPIVTVAEPVGETEPAYRVYFRVDRPLARRHDAVLVRLNGISSYNTTGTGYDTAARRHCYTKLIDNFKAFPRSLRHPRAGDVMRVTLRFRRPPRNTVVAHVPLQVASPSVPVDASDPRRLRALGCSS